MKKWLTSKGNIFTLILLVFVVWRQAPLLLRNFEAQGIRPGHKVYTVIASPAGIKQIEFPSRNNKAVAIFWATWCGPCKIEMQRLQTSIQNEKISGKNVIAINPFENATIVRKFLLSNQFDFTFIEAPDVAQALNIEVTPTTLFIDKGTITRMSTGLSIIGIWKAEHFLEKEE